MTVYKKSKRSYGMSDPLVDVFPSPVKSQRAPTSKDFGEIGTQWVDIPNKDVYFLVSIEKGVATWINGGGGDGNFDNLAIGQDAQVGSELTAGTVKIPDLGQTYTTIVAVDSDGLLVTDEEDLVNGRLLIGGTTGATWSTLTAGGGINITNADGGITISNPGATGTTLTTDDANTVSPDGTGDTDILGYDANITTDGATANTVKIRLADDITSVGKITSSVDFEVSAGQTVINSDTNAGQAIYLHADGGVNETIQLHSDQGTGNDSIYMVSDVGGIRVVSGLGAADAISLLATDAAGGITIGAGTNGIAATITDGDFDLETGTGNINIGVDVADHDITIGDDSGSNALSVVSGTGNTAMTSTGDTTIDCAGDLELNSSAGQISIGNDNINQNINIGNQGARTITMGNSTGASSVVLDVGTGNLDLGVTATAHTTRLGSTDTTSATTIQTGTGAMTFTAGGIFDVNATGDVTIDSTGGTLGIGVGNHNNAINIGTSGTRVTTIGNGAGVSSVLIYSGTGNIDIGTNATEKDCNFGSTTAASATTVRSGTGAMTFTAGGIFDVNATGNVTIDSSGIFDVSVATAVTIDSTGGTIGIGVDNDDNDINIGTAGIREVTIGNQTDANSGVTIEGGATSGIAINGSGMTSLGLVTDSAAAAAITINALNGGATFTGLTTASGATQQFTITNSECTVDSYPQVTVMNKGTNDAKINYQRITTAAGSFTVDTINSGTQALNGDVIITFWIYKA